MRQLKCTYVLDVEAVILRVSERSIHRLNQEFFVAFVCEANQKSHHLSCREICGQQRYWEETLADCF